MLSKLRILRKLLGVSDDLQQKGWYASRTVWVNLLALAALALVELGVLADVSDVDTNAIAVGVLAVVNVVLRAMTGSRIGSKPVARSKTDSVLDQQQRDLAALGRDIERKKRSR